MIAVDNCHGLGELYDVSCYPTMHGMDDVMVLVFESKMVYPHLVGRLMSL